MCTNAPRLPANKGLWWCAAGSRQVTTPQRRSPRDNSPSVSFCLHLLLLGESDRKRERETAPTPANTMISPSLPSSPSLPALQMSDVDTCVCFGEKCLHHPLAVAIMFARGVTSKILSRQVNPSDRPFPTNPSIIKEETKKK